MTVLISLVIAVCLFTVAWTAGRKYIARRDHEADNTAARDLYDRYLCDVEAITQAYLFQAPSDAEWLAEISARACTSTERGWSPAAGVCAPPAPQCPLEEPCAAISAPRGRGTVKEAVEHADRVRIAIVGVGNCASSLVQGLEYYKDADDDDRVPGLMHVRFGPYHINDVEVVAAFDVDAKKVGRDLTEAINASENNTIKIAEVPPTGVTVQRGPTLDGLSECYREIITESDEPPADVVQVLRASGADVLVSYLPVGSEEADRYYAQCAIDAHVAFVNALPVLIASNPE